MGHSQLCLGYLVILPLGEHEHHFLGQGPTPGLSLKTLVEPTCLHMSRDRAEAGKKVKSMSLIMQGGGKERKRRGRQRRDKEGVLHC